MRDTLLQRREEQRRQRRIDLWKDERGKLRRALSDLLPGGSVVVFGSLTRRGVFNDGSDIDLALREEPKNMTIFLLQALLEERMRRSVDLILLHESRLKEKILREGEEWTL